jgi:hypothetical protein
MIVGREDGGESLTGVGITSKLGNSGGGDQAGRSQGANEVGNGETHDCGFNGAMKLVGLLFERVEGI